MFFKPQKSVKPTEDIPEACRDQTKVAKSTKLQPGLVIGGLLGLGGVGILTITSLGFIPQSETVVSTPVTPVEPIIEPTPEAEPEPIPEPEPIDNILGHLKYEEAPLSELEYVTNDGSVQLRKAAATKFLEMQTAARKEGINLVAISGYRSFATQEYLFFQVKEERNQVTSKRAEVSAPPGYSEHHTGYAIDIGDGNVPATHVSPDFEKTPAFRWLEKNAAKYSFELSFTRDNPQGIMYEPWHWRFVGDSHSLETFYKARNL